MIFWLLVAIYFAEVSTLASEFPPGEWRVIGAGLGRTGTDSMKQALGVLGLGDIYHMKDLLRGHQCTVDHIRNVWIPLSNGNYNVTEIKDRLACFGGGVDYPVSPYFRELMDIYPTAKVLLTSRPSKRWAISARSTICPAALARGADFNMTTPFKLPWHNTILRLFLPQAPGTETAYYKKMMTGVVAKIEYPYRVYLSERNKRNSSLNTSVLEVLNDQIFHEPKQHFFSDNSSAVAYCRGSIIEMMTLYDSWEYYVKSVVPSHRLVVFRVGEDGWDDLRSRLNLSIALEVNIERAGNSKSDPQSFPHINTTADYYNMIMGQKLLACLIIVSLGLLTTLVVVIIWYCACRGRRTQRSKLMNKYYRDLYLGNDSDSKFD